MKGRAISPGRVKGQAIVSPVPLSFYGGVDPKTGVVTERGHPLEGRCVAGRVLVFPRGKGSTVGSYVIYGLSKNGVAPCAVVNHETEIIVAAGVILAGIPCVDHVDVGLLQDDDWLVVDGDEGTVDRA